MDVVTLSLARQSADRLEKTLTEDKEVTITWDGDINGKDMAWTNAYNWGWCRVSDLTPSAEELQTAVFKMKGSLGNWNDINEFLNQPGLNISYFDNDISYVFAVAVVYKDNVKIPYQSGVIAPKAGLYFGYKLLGDEDATVVEMVYKKKVIKPDLLPQTNEILLNDYGLGDIEMLIGMSISTGGVSHTLNVGATLREQFWAAVTQNNPPALVLASTILAVGETLRTYPAHVQCDSNGMAHGLSITITLPYNDEVMTVGVFLYSDKSMAEGEIGVIVTISKTPTPGGV